MVLFMFTYAAIQLDGLHLRLDDEYIALISPAIVGVVENCFHFHKIIYYVVPLCLTIVKYFLMSNE